MWADGHSKVQALGKRVARRRTGWRLLSRVVFLVPACSPCSLPFCLFIDVAHLLQRSCHKKENHEHEDKRHDAASPRVKERRREKARKGKDRHPREKTQSAEAGVHLAGALTPEGGRGSAGGYRTTCQYGEDYRRKNCNSDNEADIERAEAPGIEERRQILEMKHVEQRLGDSRSRHVLLKENP
ncbi:hypothetical protein C8J57DRAFT_1368288 [Mycena rebaudengoi]|nr:hypothetical protein C8J57DRAFT_1368288 [Mycena rebaudengoi]